MHEREAHPGEGSDRLSVLVSPLFGSIPLHFLVKDDLHSCPYLPGEQAQEETFASNALHPELYHDFMDHGFRRSGKFFYRPCCPSCRSCRPLRVSSSGFRPGKSLRRVWKRNQDLDVRICSPRFTVEKFRIYQDYLARQHGAVQPGSMRDFQSSLYSSAVATVEFEYRLGGRLVAVSVADISSRSLSSVYVYYDVNFSDRSLGTFSAVREILFCRERLIPHYYLGFFVAGCPSMSYKGRFKPHEILTPSLRWVAVTGPERGDPSRSGPD
jgi:leucyl-tRNA---protein transferase